MLKVGELGWIRGIQENTLIREVGRQPRRVDEIIQKEGLGRLEQLVQAILRQDSHVHALPHVDNTVLRRNLKNRNERLRRPSMFVARTAVA